MKLIALVATMLAAVIVTAQGPKTGSRPNITLFQRVDLIEGVKLPAYSTGLTAGRWELYFLSWNTEKAEINLGGQLCSLGSGLTLSGYFARTEHDGKDYILPWLSYRGKLGSAKLSADVAEYLPVNGGEHILYVPEASSRWTVAHDLDLGLVASVTKTEGKPAPIRLGLTARFRSGAYSVKIHFQPWSINGKAPARLRLQVVIPL
ncbi:MAG: hypothetical protein AAB774_02740 [Patescibacteria group bacterium]